MEALPIAPLLPFLPFSAVLSFPARAFLILFSAVVICRYCVALLLLFLKNQRVHSRSEGFFFLGGGSEQLGID